MEIAVTLLYEVWQNCDQSQFFKNPERGSSLPTAATGVTKREAILRPTAAVELETEQQNWMESTVP